jgi:hypothetical protein
MVLILTRYYNTYVPDAIRQCGQSWWWLWSTVSKKWARGGGSFILSEGWLCAVLGPKGRAYSVLILIS